MRKAEATESRLLQFLVQLLTDAYHNDADVAVAGGNSGSCAATFLLFMQPATRGQQIRDSGISNDPTNLWSSLQERRSSGKPIKKPVTPGSVGPKRPASAQRQQQPQATLPVATQTDRLEADNTGRSAFGPENNAAVAAANPPCHDAAAQAGPTERMAHAAGRRNQPPLPKTAAHIWEEDDALSAVSVITELSRSQDLTPPAAASRASMTGQLASDLRQMESLAHCMGADEYGAGHTPMQPQQAVPAPPAAGGALSPSPRFYTGGQQSGSVQRREEAQQAAETPAPAQMPGVQRLPANVFVRMPPPPLPPRRNSCRHCKPALVRLPAATAARVCPPAAGAMGGSGVLGSALPHQHGAQLAADARSSATGGSSDVSGRRSSASLQRLAARRKGGNSTSRRDHYTEDRGCSPIVTLGALVTLLAPAARHAVALSAELDVLQM